MTSRVVLIRELGRTARSHHGHVIAERLIGTRSFVDVIDHHTGNRRTLDPDRLAPDTPRTRPGRRRACPYCIALTA